MFSIHICLEFVLFFVGFFLILLTFFSKKKNREFYKVNLINYRNFILQSVITVFDKSSKISKKCVCSRLVAEKGFEWEVFAHFVYYY